MAMSLIQIVLQLSLLLHCFSDSYQGVGKGVHHPACKRFPFKGNLKLRKKQTG